MKKLLLVLSAIIIPLFFYAQENSIGQENGIEKEITLWGQKAHVLDCGDHYWFQGDIKLNKKDVEEDNNDIRTKGAVVNGRVWDNCTVHYTINRDLPNKERVHQAIAHIENRTHIRFVQRTTQKNYVEIIISNDDSYSDYIGKKGGKQIVGLTDGADTGTTIHEFGHALGLFHEQCRQDRDNYLIVRFDLMTSNSEKYQYRKYSERGDSGYDHGIFDFESIMLYPSSKVMTKKDGSHFWTQKYSLSEGDIAALNSKYWKDPQIFSIGSTVHCLNDNFTYTINNLPYGASVLWQAATNHVSFVSGQGSKTATFKATANGAAKVKAIIEYNGKKYIPENSDVWVGIPSTISYSDIYFLGEASEPPARIDLISPGLIDPNGPKFLTVPIFYKNRTYPLDAPSFKTKNGTEGLIWSVAGGASIMGHGLYSATLVIDGWHSFRITLTNKNRCGNSDQPYINYGKIFTADQERPIFDEEPGLAIPDPLLSGDNGSSTSIKQVSTDDVYTFNIYDVMTGRIVHQEKEVSDFNIDNTTLRSGIYIIEKTDNGGNVTKTKVKKK